MFRILLKTSPIVTTLILLFGLANGVAGIFLVSYISAAVADVGTHAGQLMPYIALCAVTAGCTWISQSLSAYLSQRIALHLRADLTQKILSASLHRLEETGFSRLLTNLTGDIPILVAASMTIPILAIELCILLGALVYLFFLSSQLLIGLILFLMLAVSIFLLISKPANFFFRKAREEYGSLQQHFRSLVMGIKELKLNDRWKISFLSEQFEPSLNRLFRSELRARSISIAANSIGNILFFVLIGLLMYVAPRVLNVPQHVLVGYVLTVLYTMAPISGMLSNYQAISQGKIAHERLNELKRHLPSESELSPRISVGTKSPNWKILRLKNISYSYSSSDTTVAVGPVSLELSPGEVIFVTGGNGSGKTTLAKVLTGLYEPSSGTMELDDCVIDDANRGWYRQHFAAVFSDFHLFQSLLGAAQEIDGDQRAAEILLKLKLASKVTVKDGILSTTDLSAGERKRLALLAAYLENKPIYVLDEWAADQDPIFKEFFYRHLLAELKSRNKCVVVITHDDRYFVAADRIVNVSPR